VTINSDIIVNAAYAYYNNISDMFGSQVSNYIIGNEVKGIGCNVFYGCSITSVTVGNNVTSIRSRAFYNCSSLNTIHVKASTPPALRNDAFCIVSVAICYIPCGTKAVYEASDWAQYIGKFVEECELFNVDNIQINGIAL
jgi:hypothetical protein